MPQLPDQPPQRPPQFQPPNHKNNFLYVIIFALLLTVAYYIFNPQGATKDANKATEIPISQLATEYKNSKYTKIELKKDKIYATDKNSKEVFAVKPEEENLKDLGFYDPKITTEIKAVSNEAAAFWMNVISGWLPIILFIALIVFMAKQLGK